MSCFHPLKAWQVGFHESGKPMYQITSYDAIYLIKHRFKDIYVPAFEKIPTDDFNVKITEFKEIPCGHCIGCRLDYSKQWAQRCLLEMKYHDTASFITLTYDDDHIRFSDKNIPTLDKRDLQLFMKRLRKKFPDKVIKYYSAGEYGSTTHRPHYHIILFGEDFSQDRKYYKRSRNGDVYFTSDTLDKLWNKGIAIIGDVTFQSVAYVARYTTKKLGNHDKNIYDQLGIIPEFTIMSRRPGIGRRYYDENKEEIYRFDEITLPNGLRLKPPKYYDSLYDVDYPSDMERIKDKRCKIMEDLKESKLNMTSLSYLEMLQSKEDNLNAKVRSLKRKEI